LTKISISSFSHHGPFFSWLLISDYMVKFLNISLWRICFKNFGEYPKQSQVIQGDTRPSI